MASSHFLLAAFSLTFPLLSVDKAVTIDPTEGFTALPLNKSNLGIQRPYNVPENQRYSFVDGVHKFWVYKTDKPHSPTSHTNARTEIGIRGYNYSSGVWQFEGHGYVPSGTSGVCIMHIFGAVGHATTIMLRIYDGKLSYYRYPVIVSNIYDKWFCLNVIHDVDASKLQVFIDGEKVFEGPGRGGSSHSFKFGVYAQDDDSDCMESRWKNITIFKKY